MKPKPIRLYFRVAMMLLMLLTTMTAWAGTTTETRTATWYMDGGTSPITTLQDDHTLVSGGMVLKYVPASPNLDKIVLTNNGGRKQTSFNRSVNNAYIEFTNLEGTVKSVELTNFIFYDSGMQMYVGLNKDNTSTLLHLQGTANDYDFPSNDNYDFSNSVTFEGNLEVSSANPLRIIFSGSSSGEFCFNNGVIAITYEVEVEDTSDPGHTFSFSSTGNTLTATCNQTSQNHTCGLTSGKSTLVLTANDASYDSQRHNASLNLSDFMTETGITDISSLIEYTNKATSNVSMMAPASIGEYTVTATVTIGDSYNYNCTLTKDFSILAGYKVNNSYSQFSVSPRTALEGEEITITYTQQMDESLDGLTLTGATSGNNIAYTQSGNTYTFTMPAEDVNLNATITYPLNENDFTQSGDTYTIKTADGWNYFCRRMEVDGELNGFSGKTVVLAGEEITVTTMAGSTDHPFKGTFDGDSHTLTFNYTADRTNCAPFRITDGATIRNLHATGQIEGGAQHYLSGLVGSASGNLTIENCRVSTQISSSVSGIANNGGFVGLLSSHYNQCHITGCVFDGLIYNPNYSGTTYGCGGFVGGFSQYGYAILEDCLFLHGQYDNNGNKCELDWGNENDKNSTFFHRSNSYGEGTLTNCFYVGTRGLKQGSPAVESTDAPDNFAHFGDPTTDYGFLKVYGHTMVLDNKYYTPIYGDLVETYDYGGGKSYNIEYDDKPLGIPDITTQLWVPLLRYKRTFTNGKPVTVMMPFNFTKSAFKKSGSSDGLTGHFYEFKGIHLDPQTSKWVAVMGEPDNPETTTMKANTPYLYVPDDEPQYWYIYNDGDGVNIFTQGYDGGNKVAEYDGFEMRGTYTEKVWEENDPEIGKAYLIGDGGELIPVTAGTKIRPTECYIIQTKKRMDGKDITVSIPAVEWTGSEVAFDASTVKVWDGTTLLTQTTDYTVTAPTGTLQDTGDYPVTITGAGEYIGTKEAMFTIKGAPITIKNEANEDVKSVENAYTITTDQRGGATLTLVTPEPTTPETPPTIVTVDIPTPVVVDHVDLDRIFEAGKACTLYLPFSIAASKVSGGKFYTFTTVNESTSPWSVEYNEVTGDIVANTPYIFIPNGSNGGKIVVNNGTDKVTVCTANQHTTENGQWDFIGTYSPIVWQSGHADLGRVYGFAAEEKNGCEIGQFVRAGAGASIDPMRAYLKFTSTSAPAMDGSHSTAMDELPATMRVVIGNGVTSLTLIDNGELIMNNRVDGWYTLDGRKLSQKPTQKGMYIHNGIKVVVR